MVNRLLQTTSSSIDTSDLVTAISFLGESPRIFHLKTLPYSPELFCVSLELFEATFSMGMLNSHALEFRLLLATCLAKSSSLMHLRAFLT